MGGEMPKVVILLGPPGAGKGTQADILAERFGYAHFETSKIIEDALKNHGDAEVIEVEGKAYRYGDERTNFHGGKLVTPEVVAFWVAEKIRELAVAGTSVVFSGSPRTIFEAEQLLPLLEKLYGKGVAVVRLDVPQDESLLRNSKRRICKKCRAPVPYFPETETLTVCPKCGGPLVRRGSLDTPEVIRTRLREYEERTKPILAMARERGIAIREADGVGSIEEVAERVTAALRQERPRVAPGMA